MIYTNDRETFRQAFCLAWQKHAKKQPTDSIEGQLIQIILLHPQYHHLLENSGTYEYQEFPLEENPYLHMSLHLAIREQIAINRPNGIAKIQQSLISKYQNLHEVEHRMMNCLAHFLWSAQQNGCTPHEEEYLQQLKGI